MKPDAVLLGILKRPAPFPFVIEHPAVPVVLAKAVAHHPLHRARIRLILRDRQFAHEVYVVVRLLAAPYGPYDGP